MDNLISLPCLQEYMVKNIPPAKLQKIACQLVNPHFSSANHPNLRVTTYFLQYPTSAHQNRPQPTLLHLIGPHGVCAPPSPNPPTIQRAQVSFFHFLKKPRLPAKIQSMGKKLIHFDIEFLITNKFIYLYFSSHYYFS